MCNKTMRFFKHEELGVSELLDCFSMYDIV